MPQLSSLVVVSILYFPIQKKGGEGMIVTTTQTVENRPIDQYLGLVAGQSIWEEKVAKEIISGIAKASNDAVADYKDKMTQARLEAIAEMKAKAEKMGADAIVSISFDHLVIHDDMLMLFASGTAVKLAEPAVSN